MHSLRTSQPLESRPGGLKFAPETIAQKDRTIAHCPE
jgi:hypothetical protein